MRVTVIAVVVAVGCVAMGCSAFGSANHHSASPCAPCDDRNRTEHPNQTCSSGGSTLFNASDLLGQIFSAAAMSSGIRSLSGGVVGNLVSWLQGMNHQIVQGHHSRRKMRKTGNIKHGNSSSSCLPFWATHIDLVREVVIDPAEELLLTSLKEADIALEVRVAARAMSPSSKKLFCHALNHPTEPKSKLLQLLVCNPRELFKAFENVSREIAPRHAALGIIALRELIVFANATSSPSSTKAKHPSSLQEPHSHQEHTIESVVQIADGAVKLYLPLLVALLLPETFLSIFLVAVITGTATSIVRRLVAASRTLLLHGFAKKNVRMSRLLKRRPPVRA